MLTYRFFELGYCARPIPTLVEKTFKNIEPSVRFNYRLTLFTYSNFFWIYDSFYTREVANDKIIKKVPIWIDEFLTPLGLAHLVMQIGFQIEEGFILNTKLNRISDFNILKEALLNKYNIDSQFKFREDGNFSIFLNKSSYLKLSYIIAPYIPHEFSFLLASDSIPSLQLNSKLKIDKINSDLISSLIIYKNADIYKELAIKDNKGKSGIYR